MKKKIGIIGVTGSVGSQGLDVVLANHNMFEVVFVTAHVNKDGLLKAANKLNVKKYFLTNEKDSSAKIIDTIVDNNIDIVLFAGSGVDALPLVYNIINTKTDIALANKESIVTAGSIIMDTACKNGVKIIPVDSEHSAIFQCLMGQNKKDVYKIVLTASGGPFRFRPKDAFSYIHSSEALKHPNWSMGSKITIDSATLMNKGLELIEAKYLFDVSSDMLETVIHPESIIHSYVSFKDGSSIAQMGLPSMKTPIAFALGYPDRIFSQVEPVNLWQEKSITFYKPDLSKFKCLDIALKVLKTESNALMTAMNTANEQAVFGFLNGSISFNVIADVIEEVVGQTKLSNAQTIEEAIYNIKESAHLTEQVLKSFV